MLCLTPLNVSIRYRLLECSRKAPLRSWGSGVRYFVMHWWCLLIRRRCAGESSVPALLARLLSTKSRGLSTFWPLLFHAFACIFIVRFKRANPILQNIRSQ